MHNTIEQWVCRALSERMGQVNQMSIGVMPGQLYGEVATSKLLLGGTSLINAKVERELVTPDAGDSAAVTLRLPIALYRNRMAIPYSCGRLAASSRQVFSRLSSSGNYAVYPGKSMVKMQPTPGRFLTLKTP